MPHRFKTVFHLWISNEKERKWKSKHLPCICNVIMLYIFSRIRWHTLNVIIVIDRVGTVLRLLSAGVSEYHQVCLNVPRCVGKPSHVSSECCCLLWWFSYVCKRRIRSIILLSNFVVRMWQKREFSLVVECCSRWCRPTNDYFLYN